MELKLKFLLLLLLLQLFVIGMVQNPLKNTFKADLYIEDEEIDCMDKTFSAVADWPATTMMNIFNQCASYHRMKGDEEIGAKGVMGMEL